MPPLFLLLLRPPFSLRLFLLPPPPPAHLLLLLSSETSPSCCCRRKSLRMCAAVLAKRRCDCRGRVSSQGLSRFLNLLISWRVRWISSTPPSPTPPDRHRVCRASGNDKNDLCQVFQRLSSHLFPCLGYRHRERYQMRDTSYKR